MPTLPTTYHLAAEDPLLGPVWVVDDDDVRHTIRYALAMHGLEVRTFASGEEFLEKVKYDRPGALVLDLHMPGLSGLDVQAELLRQGSPIAVILLSSRASVRGAVDAMRNGAITFLEKPVDPEELIQNIELALRISHARAKKFKLHGIINTLSKREKDIFEYLCQGLRTNEIADKVSRSQRTIEVHRAHIARKLAPYNIPQLLFELNEANVMLASRFMPGLDASLTGRRRPLPGERRRIADM